MSTATALALRVLLPAARPPVGTRVGGHPGLRPARVPATARRPEADRFAYLKRLHD